MGLAALIITGSAVSLYASLDWRLPEATETPAAAALSSNALEVSLPLPPLEVRKSPVTDSATPPSALSTTRPLPYTEATGSKQASPADRSEQQGEVTQKPPAPGAIASDTTEHQSPPNKASALAESSAAATGDQISDTAEGWIEESVKPGDSMSRVFSRMGLSANLLHRILSSSDDAKRLIRIKPGEIVKVRVNGQGDFQELILQRNAIRSIQVQANEDEFNTKTHERRLDKRIAQASGTITNSLYEGAQRAGLSDELIMELAEIFGWDIDFALEIRAGDHFSLIYEERYLDGKVYDSGPILAAEFVNSGKVFRAVRYKDSEGHSDYYSPDGHSMRKAFLRAPVDFRRISSKFTKARWHPVLGKKRPHKGVDYAAAIGTPIKAAGDGKVIFRGRKGGYGNAVIISHANKYTTLYGHLSKFQRSVTTGSRVRQGQTIGYVGKSGLATGPHLHYEFRVAGVHRNPLTVKLPAALPIESRYRKDFETRSAPLLSQLDLLSKTQLASAE
ncbi:MAG: peptidoglycan DD-metalloendopeptidase family protein [Gammaproteobacteria bacterium]|nr:peptidoglycan DD-metalloendopeptidase family protein [Gammaproteobacteria bacterium]